MRPQGLRGQGIEWNALPSRALLSRDREESAGDVESHMPLTRSEVMARIRGRDTSPEKRIRSVLWRAGFRYRLHKRVCNIRPDLVMSGRRLVVFIDGCFWHGCPLHYSSPRTRRRFWEEKLQANFARDVAQTRALGEAGWRVVRFWEHDAYGGDGHILRHFEQALRDTSAVAIDDWRVVRVSPLEASGDRALEKRALRRLSNPNELRFECGPRVTGRGRPARSRLP